MARGNMGIPSYSEDSDSDNEDIHSVDELVHVVKFFEDVCTKQMANQLEWKSFTRVYV